MAKYKVVIYYPDGNSEELDEIFSNEAEAEEYGLTYISEYSLGGEILLMSDTGDYLLEEHDAGFEDVEIGD